MKRVLAKSDQQKTVENLSILIGSLCKQFTHSLFCAVLGCHNDARMNISIAISAARHGATIANHVRVKELIKVSFLNLGQ